MRKWLLAGVFVPCFSLAGQVSARAALINADLDLSTAVYTQGMGSTLAAMLGEKGVLVWPGAGVVQGGVQGAKFFARQPFLSAAHLSWQPFRIEISRDSSLAVLVGVAVFDRPASPPIAEIHRIGRYLETWHRVRGQWQLEAFAITNLVASGETIWNPLIGPAELPLLHAVGSAAPFIAADSTFASDAGVIGASRAFAKWAAPDAVTLAPTGELNVGPERIGAVLASNTAHWQWAAVAAGTSDDGTLGWTVGQAVITPAGGGVPSKSKYLTLWRKMPDGSIRFTADGGNGRP
jgi:hypothetical protein